MTKAEDKEERLVIKLMQQMLFGKSAGTPRPEQVPYTREHAKRYRIWDHGRIGKIECAVSRAVEPGRTYTTGQLVRAVYHNRFYSDDWDAPPIELKSYHYLQIRKSAPTFMDCIGRDNRRPGKPYLWIARQEYFHDVRARKTERDRIRRQNARRNKP